MFKDFQYPVFVKASDVQTDLYAAIADGIGLVYKSERRGRTIKARFENVPLEFEQSGAFPEYSYANTYHNRPLRDVIIEFLSSTRAFLFVDGVEEADIEVRTSLKEDLSYLSFSSGSFGIMASSRSGDFTGMIEGFI